MVFQVLLEVTPDHYEKWSKIKKQRKRWKEKKKNYIGRKEGDKDENAIIASQGKARIDRWLQIEAKIIILSLKANLTHN